MQESNEPQATSWRRPLKGWRWLAGWAVVIASLAALILLCYVESMILGGNLVPQQ